jgi:hypothetical protein
MIHWCFIRAEAKFLESEKFKFKLFPLTITKCDELFEKFGSTHHRHGNAKVRQHSMEGDYFH